MCVCHNSREDLDCSTFTTTTLINQHRLHVEDVFCLSNLRVAPHALVVGRVGDDGRWPLRP